MSMRCKFCNGRTTTIEFIGYMTAEVFLLLKESIKSRGCVESWNCFMAVFSNKIKMPCSTCQKIECWVPEIEQEHSLIESKKNKKEQFHV